MTRRLTMAAFQDAAAIVTHLAHVLVIDPTLCRVLGHHWHVWIGPTQPYLVCDRCGRSEDAR